MSSVAVLVILFIFSYFGYKIYQIKLLKRKLDWLPSVPTKPIVGNALEFGDTSELIGDLLRLIANHGKTFVAEFPTHLCIFTTDYDFTEFVLSTYNLLNKSKDYEFIHKWLGTGLLTSDGPKWKPRRRLITPAFHFSILETFLDSFEANGKVLIEKLKKEVGKESTDIYPFITLYALDVILETAMGVKLNVQSNTNSKYVDNVKFMCRIGVERTTSLLKRHDWLYFLTPHYYKEKKAVEELHAVTYSVIDSKIKKLNEVISTKKTDDDVFGKKEKLAFLDILLKSTVDGEPLSREDLREEVDTFMFEGHDTTSSAMSFALYLLAGHPEVQERAVEEQKLLFADDRFRSSTYSDLQEMKYLECVIKESLRLYPSVPMFGRYVDKDTTYKGNLLPEGINIYIVAYGVLRDPDNFPNPDKFDPSRFETTDGKKPYSFIPFSAGPRNCIGQKFAMLEMKSTLSKILRNFELLPTVPEHKLILLSEAVLKSRNGIKIRVADRKW